MPPEPTNPLPIDQQIDQIGADVVSEVMNQRDVTKFILQSIRARLIPEPTYVRNMGNDAVEFGWLPDQGQLESPGNRHRKTHFTCRAPAPVSSISTSTPSGSTSSTCSSMATPSGSRRICWSS